MTQSPTPCSAATTSATGNVAPLINEVRPALARLIASGETTTIDLRAIPLGPGEEDQIEARLGRGEVKVRIDALGPSEIMETAFPGVWLVVHRNAEEEIIGKFIEIARVPEIVISPYEDLEDALASICAMSKTL